MGPMETFANDLFTQMIELFIYAMSLGVGVVVAIALLIFLLIRVASRKPVAV